MLKVILGGVYRHLFLIVALLTFVMGDFSANMAHDTAALLWTVFLAIYFKLDDLVEKLTMPPNITLSLVESEVKS